MSEYVIGIDVGGSSTKIVAFDENNKLITPLSVRANDQITSVYGAVGKFTSENDISLESIKNVMMTGVGSTYVDKPLYTLKCRYVPEFECIGRGGLYLSGLDKAIIVSLGTGTALTYAEKGKKVEYLGGTGVGGGTLAGLSKQMLKMYSLDHVVDLAKDGNLENVDLRIKDITNTKAKSFGDLPENMTASNFGKIGDMATKSDIALGVVNMVFEVAGMLAVFAARNYNVKDIVLTGYLAEIPQCKEIFDGLGKMFGYNFIIPENAQFSTVIGAALSK